MDRNPSMFLAEKLDFRKMIKFLAEWVRETYWIKSINKSINNRSGITPA